MVVGSGACVGRARTCGLGRDVRLQLHHDAAQRRRVAVAAGACEGGAGACAGGGEEGRGCRAAAAHRLQPAGPWLLGPRATHRPSFRSKYTRGLACSGTKQDRRREEVSALLLPVLAAMRARSTPRTAWWARGEAGLAVHRQMTVHSCQSLSHRCGGIRTLGLRSSDEDPGPGPSRLHWPHRVGSAERWAVRPLLLRRSRHRAGILAGARAHCVCCRGWRCARLRLCVHTGRGVLQLGQEP